MKRNVKVSVLTVALAGGLALGAGAATTATWVSAQIRPDITVQVNGVSRTLLDGDGNAVYPITVNGTSYLPVRAMGEVVGMEVKWDGATQTIRLSDRSGARPEDQDGAAADYKGYLSQAEELKAKVDALEKRVQSFTASQGRQAWRELQREMDELDNKLDRLEDVVKGAYRKGILTASEYRTLDQKLDEMDDRIDHLDDWHDDDWDDHDDWDDDWDD